MIMYNFYCGIPLNRLEMCLFPSAVNSVNLLLVTVPSLLDQ